MSIILQYKIVLNIQIKLNNKAGALFPDKFFYITAISLVIHRVFVFIN